jgi:hypothetical protein
MHLAHTRPSNLNVELRHRSDHDLWRRSAERWASIGPGGSRRFFALGSDATAPRFREETYRVWRRLPGPQWRVERSGVRDITTILDGRRWWSTDGRGGFVTNVRPDGSLDDRVGGSWPDRLVEIMFDPSFIPAVVVMTIAGETWLAGRVAITAVAEPRMDRDFRGLDWPYADEFRLAVDAEFGTLLRHEAMLDGRPFIVSEVTSMSFQPLPDHLFVGPPDARLPHYRRITRRSTTACCEIARVVGGTNCRSQTARIPACNGWS